MSDPRLIVVGERAELARRAAAEVATRARAALAARGTFHVALAGGTTPRELYAELARAGELDFARFEAWFGDERCVGPDDERSNFRMARLALLEPAGIPRARWHPMRAWEGTPEEAARAYADELGRAFGGAPRLDLALLGLGADGHTASLFPGSPALEETARAAVAVAAADVTRITLTIPTLLAARELLFVVAGAEKRAALAAVLAGGGAAEHLPARRVAAAHPSCAWIVDRAAARELTGRAQA